MPKKTTGHTLPSEIALAHTWANLERTYTDCRHYWLDEAERLRWHHAPSPVLAGFQVFSCGRFVEAWGHMWERDKLPEGVLIYCVDGKGYYQADDRDWVIGAGDLLYAPPNTHHLYWADGRHPWSIYWLHLAGPQLPHYQSILGLIERGPVRHLGLRPEMIAEFDRLLANMPANMPANASDETRWLCLQTAALSIIGHIAALPRNMAEIATAYGPIQQAIALMNESLELPFEMARYARAAGCSDRHFIRWFKQVTGNSPAAWFTQRKIQRACALLTMPNIRVKEVATRLSYEDPLYFSKVFKRVVGMSPEDYRQKLVENQHLFGSRR